MTFIYIKVQDIEACKQITLKVNLRDAKRLRLRKIKTVLQKAMWQIHTLLNTASTAMIVNSNNFTQSEDNSSFDLYCGTVKLSNNKMSLTEILELCESLQLVYSHENTVTHTPHASSFRETNMKTSIFHNAEEISDTTSAATTTINNNNNSGEKKLEWEETESTAIECLLTVKHYHCHQHETQSEIDNIKKGNRWEKWEKKKGVNHCKHSGTNVGQETFCKELELNHDDNSICVNTEREGNIIYQNCTNKKDAENCKKSSRTMCEDQQRFVNNRARQSELYSSTEHRPPLAPPSPINGGTPRERLSINLGSNNNINNNNNDDNADEYECNNNSNDDDVDVESIASLTVSVSSKSESNNSSCNVNEADKETEELKEQQIAEEEECEEEEEREYLPFAKIIYPSTTLTRSDNKQEQRCKKINLAQIETIIVDEELRIDNDVISDSNCHQCKNNNINNNSNNLIKDSTSANVHGDNLSPLSELQTLQDSTNVSVNMRQDYQSKQCNLPSYVDSLLLLPCSDYSTNNKMCISHSKCNDNDANKMHDSQSTTTYMYINYLENKVRELELKLQILQKEVKRERSVDLVLYRLQ